MDNPSGGAASAREWNAAAPMIRGPAVGLAYGGFWIRVLAYVIDAIVIAIVAAILGPPTGSGTVVQTGADTFVEINARGGGVNGAVSLVYFVAFWALRGQTLGMMPFGLRVVIADDGRPVGLGRALVRYLGLIVSFFVLFLGVIWVAFDSRKQGWHDKIAGTVVVRPQ